MDPRTLNRRLVDSLVTFAWTEWAQMGVLAAPARHSRWAQDPEALIVFSLEVARTEPRLFDELLDWLALNEPLLSVRRLQAMCVDEADRAHARSPGLARPPASARDRLRAISTTCSRDCRCCWRCRGSSAVGHAVLHNRDVNPRII